MFTQKKTKARKRELTPGKSEILEDEFFADVWGLLHDVNATLYTGTCLHRIHLEQASFSLLKFRPFTSILKKFGYNESRLTRPLSFASKFLVTRYELHPV